MNKQSLLSVIADQKKWLSIDKPIPREAFHQNINETSSKFIHIFSGIRRCGKSTLLQILRTQQKEQDYYINFDDERLLHFEVSDFQRLYEVFLEQFGEQRTFYFDEIQNIPKWERFIRRLYDMGHKVYLTGSNAHLLSKELGTHLTGRYLRTELYPFSFREYLEYKQHTFKESTLLTTEERVGMKKFFLSYVEEGGFPEYLSTGKVEYLHQLYESILYKDIMVRYQLPQERVIKELGLYYASNLGTLTSFNKLKTLFGAGSPTTIKDYLGYFENTYLFFSLTKFDYSLSKQIYAPKKVYCIDTRLAMEIGFRFSQDQGRFYENVVFLALRRLGKELYYHSLKHECDFLVKEGTTITAAIQVTKSLDAEHTRKREYAGLLEAMSTHHLSTGLILTEDEEGAEEITHDGRQYTLRILPLWKWLLSTPLSFEKKNKSIPLR